MEIGKARELQILFSTFVAYVLVFFILKRVFESEVFYCCLVFVAHSCKCNFTSKLYYILAVFVTNIYFDCYTGCFTSFKTLIMQ